MGSPLQKLRKEAGYRTVREIAEACGFTQSSMTRYEKEPDNIPMRSAWKIADVLGCSIDDVVGRENPLTADLRGEHQRRRDALPASLRESLDDYLGYLEGKADEAEDCGRRELEGCYADMFRAYFVMSMEGMGEDERREVMRHGSDEAARNRFREFACARIVNIAGDYLEGGEILNGLMRAYDRFYLEPRPDGAS